MLRALTILTSFLADLFRPRAVLQAENALLCHQLSIAQRKLPRRLRLSIVNGRPSPGAFSQFNSAGGDAAHTAQLEQGKLIQSLFADWAVVNTLYREEDWTLSSGRALLVEQENLERLRQARGVS